MASNLITLPDIQRLSNRVIRILGANPGKFTLQGTNTYLVGTGARRWLIDTGEGTTKWFDLLKHVLTSERATVEAAILTHWHRDHVGGVSDLISLSPDVKVYKHQPGPRELDVEDNQTFNLEGATLRVVLSPGHTTDHVAVVLEEEKAIFTGDSVLGHGTAVFEELGTYLLSLQKMSNQFCNRAYPGHGDIIEDCRARIAEYIQHRYQREHQVIEILSSAPGNEFWSPEQIVKIIYKDVPNNLHLAAERGVLLILKKLELDGIAVKESSTNRWRYQNTKLSPQTEV
ncbi:Metallo-hydrolase/oxidoreductase [Xylona heveae TC161]|uniref:Metallo-hydrolase/oxidoreductase n=1 Tax=Xylona heveae (strain CBS 132557 / TC161) TaxID=1328760 RepID=A0A164ZBL1_XYLHT|nr:Metallo-hydrolase/oxidoreductase [Xylona heveae TC161]KZF18901.1 Metallo-hydrolase/oxidoreductase [Xylona heveae TC161]